MSICMMFFLLSGAIRGAEHHTRKVVRIPCASFERLMEVDENRKPVSGYAFDYIQTIGTYAGWEI